LIAAAMLALAAMLAWGSGHAAERPGSCPASAPAHSSLHQQIVATRAGPLAYYRFGHGTPLLLITGYRSTVSQWNGAFLDALASRHDVIVLENPGVGGSRSDHPPETMEGLADTVSDFIEALQLRRVDVLGWSMGGMVAQKLALEHPQQVKALVLMSTAPPGPKATPVSPSMLAVLSGHTDSPFDAIMGALFPPGAKAQAVQCFRSEMFHPGDYGHVSVDERVAGAQLQAMSAWWNDDRAAAALKHVKVPALVIVGSADSVLSPDNARLLTQSLSNATLDEVPNTGHALMYQDPFGTADRIDRFLSHSPHYNSR